MVSFTPNIGLAKPTNSELAKNWIEGLEYQLTNNSIVEDKSDINYTSYTPTLGATTTPPGIGAGRIAGEYQDIQGFIMGNFVVEFTDPGVVGGSGEFGISLPVAPDATFHTVGNAFNNLTGANSVIGEGYIVDASNLSLTGPVALDMVTVSGTTYARLITGVFAAPTKTTRVFAAGMPSNLGTGDKWTGSFWYKRS